MHAYVSTAARDGWYAFSARHDVNVTALLEALGLALAEQTSTQQQLPPLLRRAVSEAREIASARSSRARPSTR